MADFYCEKHKMMASECYDEHELILDSSADIFYFGEQSKKLFKRIEHKPNFLGKICVFCYIGDCLDRFQIQAGNEPVELGGKK